MNPNYNRKPHLYKVGLFYLTLGLIMTMDSEALARIRNLRIQNRVIIPSFLIN